MSHLGSQRPKQINGPIECLNAFSIVGTLESTCE